jgi:uncharacterized lipoprotein YajG
MPSVCQRARALILALLFIGCSSAAAPSTVSLLYTPEKMVEPIKGAGMVTVTVRDLRADPKKVGGVSGSVRMTGNGPITTSQDVREVVKNALETELRNRGFSIGANTAFVLIDVTRFDVQHVVAATLIGRHYESHAGILMRVEVRGASQNILYSRLISGESNSKDGSDQQTLNVALEAAAKDLFDDGGFTNAILTADRGLKKAR